MAVKEKSKINTVLLLKICLITVIALVIGACIVFYVKLKIDGREALRNAKNVLLSLRAADIEMYGKGMCVYNPMNDNGLEEGAAKKASEFYVPEGEYMITSYNYDDHDITGFVYDEGRYEVSYWKESNRITWIVDFNLNVFTFDEVE